MKLLPSFLVLVVARGLTLARLAGSHLYVWLLIITDREGPQAWGTSLILLYLFMALSDLLDGPLARMAGSPSILWGRMDVAADIAFNTLSLSAASCLGSVGPWVPAGVAFLGGRFILRNWRNPAVSEKGHDEDRAGKAAGVIYYLLVGAVVLELSVEGEAGRWAVARAGDAVFLYTLFVLLRKRAGAPTPSAS